MSRLWDRQPWPNAARCGGACSDKATYHIVTAKSAQMAHSVRLLTCVRKRIHRVHKLEITAGSPQRRESTATGPEHRCRLFGDNITANHLNIDYFTQCIGYKRQDHHPYGDQSHVASIYLGKDSTDCQDCCGGAPERHANVAVVLKAELLTIHLQSLQ